MFTTQTFLLPPESGVTEQRTQRIVVDWYKRVSVAFQKQEIATLDKFYLHHTPEIFEITR